MLIDRAEIPDFWLQFLTIWSTTVENYYKNINRLPNQVGVEITHSLSKSFIHFYFL